MTLLPHMAPDPAWHAISVSAEEEDAWLELEARRDRALDHTPANEQRPGRGRAEAPDPRRTP